MMDSSKIIYTLVLVKKDDEVLLGYKKRGFGYHKWNGFGGKVEIGETIPDAAIRELEEECGLSTSILSLKKHGVLTFESVGDPVLKVVHLFSVSTFYGTVQESDEMSPKWFKIDQIPFDCMWSAGRVWLPLAYSGEVFDAFFFYDGEDLVDYKIIKS